MTAAALLPNPKDVRDLFEGLFGKDVTVGPGEPVSLNDKPAVAVYVDPTMATTALVLVDIRLGAWLAGALALLPKGGLEDAIDEGELSQGHLEALRASGSQVPFGFVTSEGSPEMREKAANAGAIFLIAKPFNEDTFKDVLDGVIS